MGKTKHYRKVSKKKKRIYGDSYVDYLRVPGTKYCGAGNRMDLGAPLNALDEACYDHDWAYTRFARKYRRKGLNPLTTYLKADDALISAAKRHGGLHGRAVAGIFSMKKRIAAPEPETAGTDVQMAKRRKLNSSYKLSKKISKAEKYRRNNAMAAANPTSNFIGRLKQTRKGMFKKKKGFQYGRGENDAIAYHPHSLTVGKLPWMVLQIDKADLEAQMDDEFQQVTGAGGLETIDFNTAISAAAGIGNANFNLKTKYDLVFRNNGYTEQKSADPDVAGDHFTCTVIADAYVFINRGDTGITPLVHMAHYYSNLQAKAHDDAEKEDYRNSMLTAYKYYSEFRKDWKLVKAKRFKTKPGEEFAVQFGVNYVGNPKRLNTASEFVPGCLYFCMRLQGDIAHEQNHSSIYISANARLNFENVALDAIGTRSQLSGKKDGVWKQQITYNNDLPQDQMDYKATGTDFEEN